jgi:hypothetical protein
MSFGSAPRWRGVGLGGREGLDRNCSQKVYVVSGVAMML